MASNHTLAAKDCPDMPSIRAHIDQLDKQIITLLAERFEYVKAAAKFKTSETSVKAPERVTAMLEKRRQWATEAGLDGDAIEKMYRDLVNHFIEQEMKSWQSSKRV